MEGVTWQKATAGNLTTTWKQGLIRTEVEFSGYLLISLINAENVSTYNPITNPSKASWYMPPSVSLPCSELFDNVESLRAFSEVCLGLFNDEGVKIILVNSASVVPKMLAALCTDALLANVGTGPPEIEKDPVSTYLLRQTLVIILSRLE